ncbi:MAG TPA: alpha/beta hydrolase-fold protein [Cellulomonas sp.]
MPRPSGPEVPAARLTFPAGVGRRPAAEELDLSGLAGLHGAPGSAAWWETVAAVGTPLWSPDGLAGTGGRPTGVPTLVFLHRDGTDAGVYLDLVGLTDRSDTAVGIMRRLPGTDVRVAAFGVEPGFVGSYGFVPFHGGLRAPAARDTPEARRWWLGVLAGSGPDPLARARQVIAKGRLRRSVATAPPRGGGAAPAEAVPAAFVWDRPDGVRQPAWLHVPAAPGPAEVGLLVLFDGRMWAEQLAVGTVLDALHADGSVPATAAVLLDSIDPARREADLADHPEFLDLLADDLLPRLVAPALARQGLVLSADPARTVVAGQSYGGLAAFRAVARRPDRFGASISQSGSFWWPSHEEPAAREVPAWLRTAPPRSGRTVIQVGRYEGSMTDASRQVADLVRERGEHLVHTEVPGGHDWAWWSDRLGAALVAALRG